jgi:carbamoyltransferase
MSSEIYILGIHDGHNCGATLSCDGRIVASVQEERLSRRKNEVGYPRQAIEDVLRIGGIGPELISEVAYASLFMHSGDHLTNLAPWYKVGIEDQRRDNDRPVDYGKKIFEIRRQERIAEVTAHLSIRKDCVVFVEHHLAHLTAAYYTAPNVTPGQPVLGLTCDGSGDGISGSVSICKGNEIERIAEIDRHASLGKIYSRVTMLMGMTPWEHEYKLMGLAPYADVQRCDAAAESLRQIIRMDDSKLAFVQGGELSTNYCYEYLRDAFENVRFDTVAGATQLFTEEILVQWVKAAIARTGIRDVVCGGGVFMNVKANMMIAQLPEVSSIYVMPSGSDESLSIGACLHRFYQRSGSLSFNDSILTDLYLGGEASRQDEQSAINATLGSGEFQVDEPKDMDAAIAEALAERQVVATCRGRMEWGARSLGNRSILATADDYRIVDRINSMIKMRDFWMPFAPSVLAEAADEYIDDPKDQKPWFMTFAYPAKQSGYEHLVAGSHPRDRTVRPQVVSHNSNPPYHRVISSFRERTGRGVVLNTSFNMHGEPIVYQPSEAIDVFRRSGLDRLALGHFILNKRDAA